MKKIFLILSLVFIFLALLSPVSQATLPTFDAVNAALNEIRNALMESQFAQDIALAMERLSQLKAQYLEMMRFNSGMDEVLEIFDGNPYTDFQPQKRSEIQQAFWDFGNVVPHMAAIENSGGVAEIRESLEAVTGAIPDSQDRPYIPFDEIQVVDAFKTAQDIRNSGSQMRSNAQALAQQARSASPKGAARLQADALSRMLVQGQENQEVLAKLIELEATQVEQVSRDEKRLEHERRKYMSDAKDYLQGFLSGGSF